MGNLAHYNGGNDGSTIAATLLSDPSVAPGRFEVNQSQMLKRYGGDISRSNMATG